MYKKKFFTHYLICASVWMALAGALSFPDRAALAAAASGAFYGLITLYAYAEVSLWLDKSRRTFWRSTRLLLLLVLKLAFLAVLLLLTMHATMFEVCLGLAGFFLNLLFTLLWEHFAAYS